MKWLEDETGDLVNLAHIQALIVSPLMAEQEAPEGVTHEILAINSQEESYRIAAGSEEEVKRVFGQIRRGLAAEGLLVRVLSHG